MALKDASVDQLLNELAPEVLDELVLRRTPISKIPWLVSVRGPFGMLGQTNYSEYWSGIIHFWSEFEQFVHEYEDFESEVPKMWAYCFETPKRKKYYIDITGNKDPEINARMFLVLNEHIGLHVHINGKWKLEEENKEDEKKEDEHV
jgi:hypothetical protein